MKTASSPDFHQLFREEAPFVWRVLRRHGVAERDLPDLCQEVFIIVLRKLPEFRGEASIKTWIYTIAARAASGHRRLMRVSRELPTAELPPQVSDRTPEHHAHARSALDVVQRALLHVGPTQREAFVLHELEGMTVQEVAEALGCRRGTAFSRVQAARAAIEAQLKRDAARSAASSRAISKGTTVASP